MKRKFLFCGVLFILTISPFAELSSQTKNEKYDKLDSIVVEAFRAGKNTPVTHSSLTKESLQKSSAVQSIPMLLSTMPSVVSSTEGGNGLGYSSLRIRGSEGSRINVTLNGIALNDGESQQVFWVNIPAFQSFLQDIQVMRGVGTSVNGSGAFGASINMRTLFSVPEPYGLAEVGAGSYNTFLTTVGAGTGRMDNGLSFDLRFSRNSGDGYIRNAGTDLKSLYASAGWHKGNSSLRFNYIMGDQTSGITWEGISREQEKLDRRYNPAGEYKDQAGNKRYYDNETDNYVQHHIQGHFTHYFNENLVLGTTLHFTRGEGFYQNYKAGKKFSEYGLQPQQIGEEIYNRSDLIIRQALDNYYTAFNSSITYTASGLKSTTGFAISYHDGDHYGNVLWAMHDNNIPDDCRWYLNSGYKWDLSAFTKAEYNVTGKMVVFADLQYRHIGYVMGGIDKDFVSLKWNDRYDFLNPKVGITFNMTPSMQFYGSVAVGRKEPGRSDIKESIKSGRANDILPEKVTDFEVGLRFSKNEFMMEANLFAMEYKDQLVPTGKLSETGYVIKENVRDSYRRGVEISAGWNPSTLVAMNANLSLSTNKILDYNQYTDLFDSDWNPVGQVQKFYEKSDISFSPSTVGMLSLSLFPVKNNYMTLTGKYVGKQYMDNTSDELTSIPSYYTLSLNMGKTFTIKGDRFVDLSLFVDNLTNHLYFSNGWTYKAQFEDGSQYLVEGIYPQAGINFTIKMAIRF